MHFKMKNKSKLDHWTGMKISGGKLIKSKCFFKKSIVHLRKCVYWIKIVQVALNCVFVPFPEGN